MHFRLYTPEDFTALYAIEEACFEPPLRFGRRYMRQIVGSSSSATWIAEEEDGQMAGFAIVDWWTRKTGELTAYIQTVEVALEWRSRGVGGELLRRMEGSAQSAGAPSIWLHVDEENAAAIRIYQAHGYLCEGRRENYYPHGQAALIYRKPLGDGPAS